MHIYFLTAIFPGRCGFPSPNPSGQMTSHKDRKEFRSNLLIQQVITTLWHIWRAQNDHRFDRKTWTVLQVHMATTSEIQGVIEPQPLQQQLNKEQVQPTTQLVLQEAAQPGQLLPGPRCYMDAAIEPAGNEEPLRKAGIGLFMHNTSSPITSLIFIQATVQEVRGPLHAETQAMLLSCMVTQALQLNEVNYISDNQTLVTTLQKNDFVNQPGDWRLRPTMQTKHTKWSKSAENRTRRRTIWRNVLGAQHLLHNVLLNVII